MCYRREALLDEKLNVTTAKEGPTIFLQTSTTWRGVAGRKHFLIPPSPHSFLEKLACERAAARVGGTEDQRERDRLGLSKLFRNIPRNSMLLLLLWLPPTPTDHCVFQEKPWGTGKIFMERRDFGDTISKELLMLVLRNLEY